MHDISDLNREGLPSAKSLIKATALALVIGCALLVTTILPAEYGIDPTGLGERMGLTVLSSANAAEANKVPSPSGTELSATKLSDSASSPVWASATKYRSDTMTLTLQPGQGAEIKAKMNTGENFVFSWEVQGGTVSFDMHGEQLNAGDEFTSYWLGRDKSSASGSFAAPFAGTHGWYWQNNGTEPVTVHLATSGFYKTLYRP